ncbi:MAG: hypothetical protein NUV73_04025 [Candidatus Daviesbacteria bacterium]|nr:hypothetical protein [Candidatus Daviesbacteria bacterium]
MKQKLIEIAGWYGTIAIVGAFALTSFSIIKPTDSLYQILNLTGSFGIIGVSLYKRVYQTVTLNSIWALIALVALGRILLNI